MMGESTTRRQRSGGFLLMVVMGLLTLLLVLCVGFLVAVRSQTNAVLHQRERTDLINLAYSGLDFASAEISARIFNTDQVDSAQYVSSAYDNLKWYKDFAVNATKPAASSKIANWDGTTGYTTFSSKRETKWVYLPADYILEGALRARIAVQVLDNNAYLSANDWLQDATPSQAQQAHIFQSALGWTDAETMRAKKMDTTSVALNKRWVVYPEVVNLFRYSEVWPLASRTLRSYIVGSDGLYYPAHSGFVGIIPKETTKAQPDERNMFKISKSLTTNTTYFNIDGPENCLAMTMTNGASLYMPILSCRPYTDPDTGHSPLNVNTCFNSGEFAVGPASGLIGGGYVAAFNGQQDLEGVFNIGSLRRIIKIGSFYAKNSTNSGVVPGIRYLDPSLYPDNANNFQFDATTHQVLRDSDGKPLRKAGAPALDVSTEGTIDPATVTIDPVDSKMSYSVTPIGSGGRPYVYKSYDDLYVALSTEEKVQLEELRTKLAVQYQETLCRYFVASYKNTRNIRYPPYDATVSTLSTFTQFGVTTSNSYYFKNYKNTYAPLLGAGGDGVAYAADNYDYTTPRFPYSVGEFRDHVKADLTAMATNNNNKAAWGYNASASKDGGEYVNFDSAGKPEVCPGKMDKRTASAIFDNICPGKRVLFPTETNLEIKDPIGQLYKRRIGIDEEVINWIHQTPTPAAPSEQLWKPKGTEVASKVNPQRMNDPYHYFLYKEDWNENGVLDTGEDLQKKPVTVTIQQQSIGYNWTPVPSTYPMDPDVLTDPNPNNKLDKFATDAEIDRMRERGQEVWTADPSNPVKGHDYLSSSGYNRFLDENVYFNTAENPINPASFDPNKPNCLIHPLPADGTFVKDSNGNMVAITSSPLLSDFNGNSKFDTIEYIPGHATLDNGGLGSDLNGDNMINTYYRTPERQLAFGPDSFSTELTTSSVSYRIVATVELCDAASVRTNPAAPLIVAHTEINADVQFAPDVETAAVKQGVSDYVNPATGAADAANDPGLHYYRNNQATIRKTRTYENDGFLTTYNVKTALKETYDPVKEAQGLQIRGGIVDDNSSKLINEYNKEHTSAAREWIDPLCVPDHDANGVKFDSSTGARKDHFQDYYKDPYQNKRRIVIRDLMNLGSGY